MRAEQWEGRTRDEDFVQRWRHPSRRGGCGCGDGGTQTTSRVLALVNVAALETLNVLLPSATFGGKPAAPVVPRSTFSTADLSSANPAAAASFAAHWVLATLFPSRKQARASTALHCIDHETAVPAPPRHQAQNAAARHVSRRRIRRSWTAWWSFI